MSFFLIETNNVNSAFLLKYNNNNNKIVYSQQIESQHTCGFTKYGCIILFKLNNQLQLDKLKETSINKRSFKTFRFDCRENKIMPSISQRSLYFRGGGKQFEQGMRGIPSVITHVVYISEPKSTTQTQHFMRYVHFNSCTKLFQWGLILLFKR